MIQPLEQVTKGKEALVECASYFGIGECGLGRYVANASQIVRLFVRAYLLFGKCPGSPISPQSRREVNMLRTGQCPCNRAWPR